jgi:hypothetical protein
MDQTEQANAFASELDNLIERYRGDFDLTLLSAIGVLEVAKLQLFAEQLEIMREGEEDDDEDP